MTSANLTLSGWLSGCVGHQDLVANVALAGSIDSLPYRACSEIR